MNEVKIKDEDGLVRDTETNAVLNSSLSSLENYKARREMMRKKENEIESLKEDVKEIKQLLKELIGR